MQAELEHAVVVVMSTKDLSEGKSAVHDYQVRSRPKLSVVSSERWAISANAFLFPSPIKLLISSFTSFAVAFSAIDRDFQILQMFRFSALGN